MTNISIYDQFILRFMDKKGRMPFSVLKRSWLYIGHQQDVTLLWVKLRFGM